jgi:hypothetical protein
LNRNKVVEPAIDEVEVRRYYREGAGMSATGGQGSR